MQKRTVVDVVPPFEVNYLFQVTWPLQEEDVDDDLPS